MYNTNTENRLIGLKFNAHTFDHNTENGTVFQDNLHVFKITN
jgi:hypothetical protein